MADLEAVGRRVMKGKHRRRSTKLKSQSAISVNAGLHDIVCTMSHNYATDFIFGHSTVQNQAESHQDPRQVRRRKH